MQRSARILTSLVLLLIGLGIVMLGSAGGVIARNLGLDDFYFLKQQLKWLIIGLFGCTAVILFPYQHWRKLAVPMGLVSIILLVLVFVPGVSAGEINGSYRWINIGPIRLQPSEIAKFSVVIIMASWMTHVGRRAERFVPGLVLPLAILGVFLGLIFLEPDFGTTMLTAVAGLAIMFAAGTRISYLAITATLGACFLALMIMQDPHRAGRILAFLYPEKYPDAAYHALQSQIAFILGGWSGVGLGESIQKEKYLPESHTDFIFAIIGEELGIVGTVLVVIAFMGIAICGMRISMNAPDNFGKLIGFGMTIMISVQVCINIGVVTGCLPTKGIALPFISYGGSSLVMSMASASVLLNIARQTP